MKKNDFIYLLAGFIFTIILFLLISATNDNNTNQNKYENHNFKIILTILDKNTGVLKVYETGLKEVKIFL